MDTLSVIRTRVSAPRLASPGPTAGQLEAILGAAVCAPDHGRLAPWRFVVVEAAARDRLGQAMAEALRRRAPETPAETLAREAAKPARAPTVVVVAARPAPGRIPQVEQILAVGAAVQNMLLAAHALDLAAVWKTGDAAYDPVVKTALGLHHDDHIAAFVYLGSAERLPPPRPTSLHGLVSHLPG